MASPLRTEEAASEDNNSMVDANLLRNALRLVHCIQKERGASCAYYASTNLHRNHTGIVMMHARNACNVAVRFFSNGQTLPVAESLEKIRHLINDTSKTETTSTGQEEQAAATTISSTVDELGFHRILVCFNTLISSVVYEYILKHISDKRTTLIWTQSEDDVDDNDTEQEATALSGEQSTSSRTVNKKGHSKALSSEINHKLSEFWTGMTPPEMHHENYAFLGSPPLSSSPSQQQQQQPSPRQDSDSEGLVYDTNDTLPLRSPAATTATSESHDRSPKVTFDDLPSSGRVARLLNLLNYFVQLKESTGVERAILSGLLHFGARKAADSRLLNDLILEVENQRHLVQQLKTLPRGPLRNLILELAQLSPALRDLQTKILNNMSLQMDEYDSDTIWNVITIYMDKLHSLELLIIEELESYLPQQTTATTPLLLEQASESTNQQVLCQALQHVLSTTNSSTSLLISQLESMSAQDIKERVLASLNAAQNQAAHQQQQQEQQQSPAQVEAPSSPRSSDASSSNLSSSMRKSISSAAASKEWDIDIYEIKFQKRIGQGASGTTYMAHWSGQNVAVKVASITEFGLEGWQKEVATLQKLHHPNIIRLLGSIYHPNPLTFCLVLEYCNGGDLATALKYPTPRNFFWNVAISIANAMTYLHSRQVIHRDLKPANVLVEGTTATGNFTVKVTDFGLATEAPSGTDTMSSSDTTGGPAVGALTGETGTYRWMAPEVIRHEPYSNLVDVYSYAVMLWQFVTREEPFCRVSAEMAAHNTAIGGERPLIPQDMPAGLVTLLEACWSESPAERWKFELVAERLQEIQASLTPTEKTWLEETHGHAVYYPRKQAVVNPSEKEAAGKKGGGKATPKSLLSGMFGGGGGGNKQNKGRR
jgi:hypothetical protein